MGGFARAARAGTSTRRAIRLSPPRGRLWVPGSRATNRITAEDRPQADDRVRIGFAAMAAEVDGSEQAPDLPKADRVVETASHLGQRLRADPDRVRRPNLASTGRLPARPARGFRPPRVISGSTALVPSVLGG